MEDNQSVTVLLVDDDEADRESIQRSFRKHKIANPLVIAENGEEALKLLRGEGSASIERPYLVLLDLNMPRMNGIQFLEALRSDSSISDAIILVLTTSDDDRDKVAAYENHVAGYIVKENAGDDFQNVVKLLDLYWRYVEFPPERAA